MSTASSIPPSDSDTLLFSWGYDLIAEYTEMVSRAAFPPDHPVVELATGSGRMSAVLVHAGYRVITGDLTQEQHERVLDRLTPFHQGQATFLTLDLTRLPFRSRSVRNLTCVNTLHEMEEPGKALDELLRVLHPEGILLIADFNSRGFNVMQRLVRETQGRDHRRGTMPMEAVMTDVRLKGRALRRFDLSLNVAIVVGGPQPAG